MKKIFKYFGLFLSVALMGAFTACDLLEQEEAEVAESVLAIKSFSPTKVVPGQEMTIYGSCFDQISEIIFPENVTVSTSKLITNEVIKVVVPAGVSADGGSIIFRKADGEEVVSKIKLTVGNTAITGYSVQLEETVKGGSLFTVYGNDLEFINKVELLDEDEKPVIIPDTGFYRKGSNSLVYYIPKKVYQGQFVGKLYTIDGKVFLLPEFTYKQPVGHWEKGKKFLWKNGLGNHVSWSSDYRFSNETNSTGEEIYAFPDAVWDASIKNSTFYVDVQADDDNNPQVRITTGWWSTTFTGADFQPGSDFFTDNEDGTWSVEIKLEGDPIMDVIDVQHLLITGDRFTPIGIYVYEDVWVEDGDGPVEVVVWTNELGEKVSWSGQYRFSSEEATTGEEIYAFPMDVWNRLKTETFYLQLTPVADWFNVRVTNGWWDASWVVGDIGANLPERMIDNGDGTYHIEINISEDTPFLDTIDQKHLLFTGEGYIPNRIYFIQ
jgi:hypothetical protein